VNSEFKWVGSQFCQFYVREGNPAQRESDLQTKKKEGGKRVIRGVLKVALEL
jgi:hypothetical protein